MTVIYAPQDGQDAIAILTRLLNKEDAHVLVDVDWLTVDGTIDISDRECDLLERLLDE